MAFSLKALILDPLKGGAHETLKVPEWDGAEVIVRAPTAGDYTAWRQAIREDAGIGESDDEKAAQAKVQDTDLTRASAQLLVRVLYERQGKATVRRVLSDADVPALAASWTRVHARLMNKALDLSGLNTEDEAKKASAASPASAS